MSDDFESGTVDKWSNNPATVASTERPFAGQWGLKYDSGLNTNGNFRAIFAPQTQIYARWRWYPTAQFTCGAGAHVFRITHNFQVRQLDTQCNGPRQFEFVGFWGNSLYPVGTVPNININAWNLMEVFFKLNDVGQSNGELRVWLNGNQVLQRTGVLWRDNSDPITEFALTTNYATMRAIWYFDDVEIWTDQP